MLEPAWQPCNSLEIGQSLIIVFLCALLYNKKVLLKQQRMLRLLSFSLLSSTSLGPLLTLSSLCTV
jgi:hypothetical protein